MTEIPVQPRVFENYLLRFGSDNYEAHVDTVRLVPAVNVTKLRGVNPGSTLTRASVSEWACVLGLAQDWSRDASLSIYLHRNIGQTVVVEFAPHGNSAGPRFTAEVLIMPGEIGGTINEFGRTEVTLPMLTAPIFTPAVEVEIARNYAPPFADTAAWTAGYAMTLLGDGSVRLTHNTGITNVLIPAQTRFPRISGVTSARYRVENRSAAAKTFRVAIWNGSAYAYGPNVEVPAGETRIVNADSVPVATGAYAQPRLHQLGPYDSPCEIVVSRPMSNPGDYYPGVYFNHDDVPAGHEVKTGLSGEAILSRWPA